LYSVKEPWQILDALAVLGCLYRTLLVSAQARHAGAIEEFVYGILDTEHFKTCFAQDTPVLATEFVSRVLRMNSGWPAPPRRRFNHASSARACVEFLNSKPASMETNEYLDRRRTGFRLPRSPSLHSAWAEVTGTSLVLRRCAAIPYVLAGHNRLQVVMPAQLSSSD
jgi:hypothetical protein